MKRLFVITLVGGIGNIIQTTPFMLWLRSQGHDVYGKADRSSYSKEACELVSCAYDKLIGPDEKLPRSISKGNMLLSSFKDSVKTMPEWAAWFRWHGFEPPEEGVQAVTKRDEMGISFDVILAPACKPSWPMKRWPYWQDLIYKFPGCAVVGLEGDGGDLDGDFEDYRGKLTLKQAAGLFYGSNLVIAEEGGMGHLSCAQGTRTLILFGGTAPLKNLPPNNGIIVKTKEKLSCQPCQFGNMYREGSGLNVIFHGCHPSQKIEGHSICMHTLTVDDVLEHV